MGRRRGVHAHGEEDRAGDRARAGNPVRRSADPAGLLGRLCRQPGRGGAGLDDRHLVAPAAHQRVPLRRRHRGGGGGDPDRDRVQRRPRTGRARSRRGHGRRSPPLYPDARRSEDSLGTLHGGVRPPRGLDAAGSRRVGALGRGRGQGSLVLRRAHRRDRRHGRRHPRRRPYRHAGLRCSVTRRGGPGLPAQRPDLRGHAARVRVRHGLGPPRRDGVHRIGGAGWLRRDALGGLPCPRAVARGQGARRDRCGRRGRPLRPVGHGCPLGSQPGQRGLLGGGGGVDRSGAGRSASPCER